MLMNSDPKPYHTQYSIVQYCAHYHCTTLHDRLIAKVLYHWHTNWSVNSMLTYVSIGTAHIGRKIILVSPSLAHDTIDL